MNPELWRRVEELFQEALDRAPEARQAFLEEVCGNDADLRRQVELLLAKDAQAKSFLEPAPLHEDSRTAVTGIIGRQFGPYRVMSLLGAGGMGEVYRAHDSKLGRDVAIKTLPSEFAQDPERLARFRREARTLALLNHPNIAAIYGLEESGGADCLILELVEGETPRGPLPVADALRIAKQIAEALEAAHDKGIIHRDLKPANVKVTPRGRVKVLDFGLAKALLGPEVDSDSSHLATTVNTATLAGNILGTPGYMSPEQTRGKGVDQRTDIWAFGCVLYELLAGTRTFQGETVSETIAAVLEREPDWQALPRKTPNTIRELLRRCLQKDEARRLESIADARRTIEETQRGSNRSRVAAVTAAVFVVAVIAGVLWLQRPASLSDSSKWVQLTKFPDSVSQPALSPDGRMVTFIRGESTFFGPGQIYVKILPDGEPVQVTHDNLEKMSPAFSPDGSRIAYTTVNPGFQWDTWVVPVLGGQPQLLLKNASGLVWTGPRQLLFSEMRMGVHMAVVAAEESRIGQHNVYVPPEEPDMAHRSYLSPDGKWVLLVEMDNEHLWEPCRVVPADGSSEGRKVGPPGGGCTSGAWSLDGKWMYLTSNAVGANHIWRQRFPNGVPEQITSGPTEEEGVAMAPDGRSFVTAVALQNASLWVHDAQGERQTSLEGNAADPRFTPDGKKLLYRIVKEAPNEFQFYRDLGEVRVADLASGRSEPLVRGFQALDYDLSADGRQVVMQTPGPDGKLQLWLAPLDHSSPPQLVPNAEGGAPRFTPSGEILFRRTEGSASAGTTGFMYRVHAGGTGMQKALDAPILLVKNISPDGKWLVAWAPLHGDGPPAMQAFPLDGGSSPVTIGGTLQVRSSLDDRASFISGNIITQGRTYTVSLSFEETLRRIPAGGFQSEEEIMRLPGARRIDAEAVPGPSADVYAFYRGTTQRNLYRVPIP
jgi:serine/threonine protein kinase